MQTPPSFTLGDLRRGGSPADISLTDTAGLGVERQEQANLHSIERAQLKPVGRYLLHTAQSYLETYHKSHEQDGKTFQDIPTKRGIISRIVCWEGPKDVLALESSEISDVLHETMMNSTTTAIDANEVTNSVLNSRPDMIDSIDGSLVGHVTTSADGKSQVATTPTKAKASSSGSMFCDVEMEIERPDEFACGSGAKRPQSAVPLTSGDRPEKAKKKGGKRTNEELRCAVHDVQCLRKDLFEKFMNINTFDVQTLKNEKTSNTQLLRELNTAQLLDDIVTVRDIQDEYEYVIKIHTHWKKIEKYTNEDLRKPSLAVMQAILDFQTLVDKVRAFLKQVPASMESWIAAENGRKLLRCGDFGEAFRAAGHTEFTSLPSKLADPVISNQKAFVELAVMIFLPSLEEEDWGGRKAALSRFFDAFDSSRSRFHSSIHIALDDFKSALFGMGNMKECVERIRREKRSEIYRSFLYGGHSAIGEELLMRAESKLQEVQELGNAESTTQQAIIVFALWF